MSLSPISSALDQLDLRQWLGEQATALGFQGLRITDTHLGEATERLQEWLDQGKHGQMEYMAKHAQLRSDPAL